MPVFEIETPAGSFEVEAPDEATALNAVRQFATPRRGHNAPEFQPIGVEGYDPATGEVTKPAGSGVEAALSSTLEGIPVAGPILQTGVENAAAGIGSAISGKPFSQVRSEMGDIVDKSQEDHPYITAAGNVGGAVLGTIPMVMAAPGAFGVGMSLPAARLSFTHATPADTQEHSRIFGTEVVFGAPHHCAEFPAILLTLPVPNADVGLYPVLQQHAEQLLRQKAGSQAGAGIVAQVAAVIAQNLSQDRARVAQVAQDLNLTPRTLQRKLSDADTSFQQVLDRTRRELAQDYLRQRGLSLAEIAFLLGFQNQSAFNHAFKEWTGASPGSYRDSLGAA